MSPRDAGRKWLESSCEGPGLFWPPRRTEEGTDILRLSDQKGQDRRAGDLILVVS